MLSRVERIIEVNEESENKQQAAETLRKNIQQRVIDRIKDLDLEDLTSTTKLLSQQCDLIRINFVENAFKEVCDNILSEEMTQELKYNTEFSKIMILTSYLNKVFTYLLRMNTSEQVIDSNEKIGAIISEAIQRHLALPFSGEQLVIIFDQVSKFKEVKSSLIKMLSNKILKHLNDLSSNQMITMILALSKLQQGSTQKLGNLTKDMILANITELTYQEIGTFLESVILLNLHKEEAIYKTINNELLNRQAKYNQEVIEKEKEKYKLAIQNAIKIYKYTCQAGQAQAIGQQMWKTLHNVIYKNKDKLSTNQIQEITYILRCALKSDVNDYTKLQLQNSVAIMQDMTRLKIDKVSYYL